jgi:tetratricopeptide (TPR) repeat protein
VKRTPARLETAVTLLRRAVELDPNYAPAWSSLGVAVKMAWFYGDRRYDTPPPLEEAARYVNRALALAPDLAEAHAALATVRDYDLSTLPHLERATRLDPGNAENWYWLYNARTLALDFEGALEAIRRTAAIDPYWIHSSWAPNAAWDLGYRDEARRYLRRTAENHPDPFQRESALWEAAYLSGDQSLAYRHARAAALIASPDMQEPAGHRVAAILLRLGVSRRGEGRGADAWLPFRDDVRSRSIRRRTSHALSGLGGFLVAGGSPDHASAPASEFRARQ